MSKCDHGFRSKLGLTYLPPSPPTAFPNLIDPLSGPGGLLVVLVARNPSVGADPVSTMVHYMGDFSPIFAIVGQLDDLHHLHPFTIRSHIFIREGISRYRELWGRINLHAVNFSPKWCRMAYPPRVAWGVLPCPMAPTYHNKNAHSNQSAVDSDCG